MVKKVIILCLCLCSMAVNAEQSENRQQDIKLIKEAHEQYQMWALSRDYFFGTRVKQDKVKALTWQYIYTQSLPKNYPGKSKLLAPFKATLTAKQIKRAKQLATVYRQQYHLNYTLDESQLRRLLALDKSKLHPTHEPLRKLNQVIEDLQQQGHFSLVEELRVNVDKLLKSKSYPIVYGHVVVDGPESASYVESNIKLIGDGLFVAHTNDRYINFSMLGYKPVMLRVDPNQQVINYGQIMLEPLSNKAKTGIVGRVSPWPGIAKGNIMLRSKVSAQLLKKDPWYNPVIPLTVLNDGKFYTTGLAPGKYQLLIDVGDKKIIREFKLSSNEIKGLSVIRL